ncbi:MAG: hypothetical protein NTW61_00995 [Candidatus Melainabacteria bacterium]|nr:hypothetical protein [Candidatus Melainabacteria bacterium]
MTLPIGSSLLPSSYPLSYPQTVAYNTQPIATSYPTAMSTAIGGYNQLPSLSTASLLGLTSSPYLDYTKLSDPTRTTLGLPPLNQGSLFSNYPSLNTGYSSDVLNPLLASNTLNSGLLNPLLNSGSIDSATGLPYGTNLYDQNTVPLSSTSSPVVQSNLQQIYAQQLAQQILQITSDTTLTPEIKAIKTRDLQLQFQSLQIASNQGMSIQDQINQVYSNPSIPADVKQSLITQLTLQNQQIAANQFAPPQPDIWKLLIGGVARQFLPGLLKPGESLQSNPLLGTLATVASALTGVDLVTGVSRPPDSTVASTDNQTTTITYDGNSNNNSNTNVLIA